MTTAEMIPTVQISLPTLEASFEEQVDQWVLDAIIGERMTFRDILRALPGVYPTVALQAIERLAKCGRLPAFIAERATAYVGRDIEPRKYNDASGLPVPHPMDFEWRFTAGAQKLLWENVLKLSERGDTIALLGTPSLFQWANRQQGNQRHCVLIDASRSTVASFSGSASSASANFGSAICCNIPHGRLPALNAQVIVVDPPWYRTHIRTFLWSAAQMCAAGGYVLLSAPSAGTRPGIKEEWEGTLKVAEGFSLYLECLQMAMLPYVSPPFERNALRAAGINNYPVEWRRGDLAVFRHSGQSIHYSNQFHYSPLSLPSPCPEWIEENIEGVRIRMRPREHSCGDPRLVGIVAGDVLPSVSRRDEYRPLADVWTSGNRIFRCADTASLRQVCRAVARGKAVAAYVARALCRTLTPDEARRANSAGEQLQQLIKTERGELDKYGW